MSWLIFGSLLLAGMACLAYWIERSVVAPAVLYPLVWSAAFLVLCLAGDFFYPVSLQTMEVCVAAAACFAIGSSVRHVPRSSSAGLCKRRLRFVRVCVLVFVTSLCALFPLFVYYIQTLAATEGGENFWIRLRMASISLFNTPGGGPFSLSANLPVFALAVALVAVRLRLRGGCSKTLELIAIFVALVYQVLTAARSGVFVLLVSVIALRVTYRRIEGRRNLLTVLALGAFFACLFVANQVTMNKGADKRYSTLVETVQLVGQEALVHAVGGVVGFDQIVADPTVIPPSQNITYFFVHTLNKLGADIEELSRHAQALRVSRDDYTNVYTAYFSYYPHYGMVGTLIVMLFLGWFAKRCYISGKAGSDVGAILYALTVHGILLSTIADEFFLTLNTWLKCAIVGYFAFCWPLRSSTSRQRSQGRLCSASCREHELLKQPLSVPRNDYSQ
jgi:oligosaccharide repeat unit polymerase